MRNQFKLVPFAGLLAALAFVPQTPAQQPRPQATGKSSDQDLSTIRVNTRLVEVDAVVRDKNGPVKGLTKEDFTILDQGKPQKISTFNVAVAGHSVNTTPLPPGTVSNRLNKLGEEPVGATVVLWDKLNTETADQSYVQKQVFDYLHTLRPGDHLALYALVKDLQIVQDFTDDPNRLIDAMKRVKPEQSLNLTASNLTDLVTGSSAIAMSQDMTVSGTSAAEMTDYAMRDRVWVTTHTLEAVAWHMAGLPGRKKLIWISGGFPTVTLDERSRLGATQLEIEEFGVQVKAAIRKLNEANVAVYPIDPRGVLSGATPASTAKGQNGEGGLTAPGIETMLQLARGTGGEAIYADNDLTAAMKTVMDDDEVTYSLGFYPVEQKADGSYHPLSVKVDRKGVEVRTRDGYYADDPKGSDTGNRRESVNAVMDNPLDATQIGLRATATPVASKPGFYRLDVKLNTNELHLTKVNDHWVAHVRYATLFSPLDTGKGTLETIQINLTDTRLREALLNGYSLGRLFELGEKKGTLRVVIQDVDTGFSGSVHVPFPPQ